MRPSRNDLYARIDALTADLAEAKKGELACASQLERVAAELSALKDEVALHIVAAEHPSSALSDARSMALSLREALEAHGIDLRLELARLEGADL